MTNELMQASTLVWSTFGGSLLSLLVLAYALGRWQGFAAGTWYGHTRERNDWFRGLTKSYPDMAVFIERAIKSDPHERLSKRTN